MGPGGLRGLQILRSGAKRVRGGFDSHAFPPPLAVLIGVVWLAAIGPTRTWAGPWDAGPPFTAQDTSGASAGSTAPDETRDPAAEAGAARPGREAATSPALKPRRPTQPRWVMLRSLVIPGWGQAHNGAWLKAAAVATGEVWLGLRLLDDRRELDRLANRVAQAREARDEDLELFLIGQHNSRLDRYVSRQWLLGGLVTLALLDAYIDAHFRDFKLEFEADPALPPGESPAGMRVSLRWGF